MDGKPAVLTDLGLSLGYVVNSRRPQLEETLLPGLFPIFPEVEHCLQVRNDDGRPAEVLLRRVDGVRRTNFKGKL